MALRLSNSPPEGVTIHFPTQTSIANHTTILHGGVNHYPHVADGRGAHPGFHGHRHGKTAHLAAAALRGIIGWKHEAIFARPVRKIS